MLGMGRFRLRNWSRKGLGLGLKIGLQLGLVLYHFWMSDSIIEFGFSLFGGGF